MLHGDAFMLASATGTKFIQKAVVLVALAMAGVTAAGAQVIPSADQVFRPGDRIALVVENALGHPGHVYGSAGHDPYDPERRRHFDGESPPAGYADVPDAAD